MTSNPLNPARDEPSTAAVHRTFGALQRALAELEQRLVDDPDLTCDRWLGQARSVAEMALLERAWAELKAPRSRAFSG